MPPTPLSLAAIDELLDGVEAQDPRYLLFPDGSYLEVTKQWPLARAAGFESLGAYRRELKRLNDYHGPRLEYRLAVAAVEHRARRRRGLQAL